MAENLDIEGRRSVRSPMQWAAEPNGGFSDAPKSRLSRPVVTEPGFSPKHVNVADQRRDAGSLLNWMEELIRARRETPEIGCGDYAIVPADAAAVLAVSYDWDSRIVLTVVNLGREPCRTTLRLDKTGWRKASTIFGEGESELRDGALTLGLGGYESRWLRLLREPEPRRERPPAAKARKGE